MRTIPLILALATAAQAQETPPPVAAVQQPAFDFMKAPPDNNAVERGRGAMLLTVGTIMIPVSAALLGTSALLWEGYRGDCSGSSCDKYAGNLAGGLVLDLLGVAAFAGGAAMLAIGAQKYVEHKKPVPRLAFNGNGFNF
jgi:hypothetical protein